MSTTFGRARDPQIPRQERVCPKHGMTTFAGYQGGSPGKTPCLQWKCMACSREKSAKYHAEGPQYTQTPRPVLRRGEECPSCHLTLPLTGVCDDCG